MTVPPTQATFGRKLADWMQRADRAGSPALVMEIGQAIVAAPGDSRSGVRFVGSHGLRAGQHRGSASQRRYQQWLDEMMDRMKPHGMLLYNADDAMRLLGNGDDCTALGTDWT